MRQVSEQILTTTQGDLGVAHQQLLAEHDKLKREFADFTYIISHDLKAPLRGIASLSSWLITDYVDTLDEPGREMLHLLQERTQRLNQMIDGVLQYSRIGRLCETHTWVDLNELIDQICHQFAPAPHVHLNIQTSLPTLLGEPLRIKQLFGYLFDNALKYNQQAHPCLQLTSQDLGHMWQFQLQDNGPGIPPKEFERVFQIFQTLQPPDQASSGLGLTLAKKIVELHGGQIWLDTVPLGSGLIVYFTWPKVAFP